MKRKKSPNQRAFKIVPQKAPVILPTPTDEELATNIGSEENVSFAMSIALQMKKKQHDADKANEPEETKRPAGRNKQYSDAELKTFKNKLLEIRERITSNSSAMKSSIGIEELDDIEPDGGDGTSQTLRLHTMNQIDFSLRTVHQIDEALHQIDNGSYGVCVSCGQLISRNRLLSSPFVKTCTDCQQALERGN